MHYLIYLIFLFSIYLIYIIPFWIFYAFSDFLAFLFQYIFAYRKKVIFKNLKNSFPEKNEKEIKKIIKGTYQNLSDILVESIKGFTLSSKKLSKRFVIKNPEILNDFFEKEQSIIGVAAHYGNWEWGATIGNLQIKHRAVGFYKPLSNKYIDNYIKRIRAENGALLRSFKNTPETFRLFKDQTCLFVMVADQSPTNMREAIWVDFLNQDTACLHGPEKYAKINNYPVIFFNTQRVKRGYYEVTMELLTENPLKLKEGELTELYMNRLEQILKDKPENWLWSHKRWKKNRSDIPKD